MLYFEIISRVRVCALIGKWQSAKHPLTNNKQTERNKPKLRELGALCASHMIRPHVEKGTESIHYRIRTFTYTFDSYCASRFAIGRWDVWDA